MVYHHNVMVYHHNVMVYHHTCNGYHHTCNGYHHTCNGYHHTSNGYHHSSNGMNIYKMVPFLQDFPMMVVMEDQKFKISWIFDLLLCPDSLVRDLYLYFGPFILVLGVCSFFMVHMEMINHHIMMINHYIMMINHYMYDDKPLHV